jgi:hypothetical protein
MTHEHQWWSPTADMPWEYCHGWFSVKPNGGTMKRSHTSLLIASVLAAVTGRILATSPINKADTRDRYTSDTKSGPTLKLSRFSTA